MLFYCSLHPEWDYSPESADYAALTDLSALLEIAAVCHPRNASKCYDELEQAGIFLGNGGFLVVRVQQDPFGDFTGRRTEWSLQVVAAAKKAVTLPLWYSFTVSGGLYLLLCCPRLEEDAPEVQPTMQRIRTMLLQLSDLLLPAAPAHRLMASDFQFGSGGIFRCFNTVHHASDYYDFLTRQSRLIFLDTESQLHNAFADDLNIYRQFSGNITEMLLQNQPAEDISTLICDRLLENCAPTIDSLHHHIQLFTLTFTDFLGSTGVVDTSYMMRQQIAYRMFRFETEADLRQNLLSLIQELARQNHTLRSVGKQKQITRIREYIVQHISEQDLTMEKLSEVFGLSTAQITSQFRSYFGITPFRFLQQARLGCAQELLRNRREKTMQQVAEAAGYTDLSTMYRAFRKYGNTTPKIFQDTVTAGTGE